MFRRLTAAASILLAATALAAPAANAEINPVSDVPDATLLLPYFEVDLGGAQQAPAQGGTASTNDNVLWGDYYYVDPAASQPDDEILVDEAGGRSAGQDGDHRGHGGGHGRG